MTHENSSGESTSGEPTSIQPPLPMAAAQSRSARIYDWGLSCWGLIGLWAYAGLAFWKGARHLQVTVDGRNYLYWQTEGSRWAGSPWDISVMSPLHGLGGLSQPIAFSLHPAYLMNQYFGNGPEGIAASFWVMLASLTLAITCVGRSVGLSPVLAVVVAQIFGIVGFPPIHAMLGFRWNWNACALYYMISGMAWPVALALFFLAGMLAIGEGSVTRSVCLLFCLPALLVYAVVCDPLYTSIMFLGVSPFCAAASISGTSVDSKRWKWATLAILIIVVLSTGMLQFYRALSGYMARGAFGNEISAEVQTYGYLVAYSFQSPSTALVVMLTLLGCWFLIRRGTPLQHAFAWAMIANQLALAITTAVYLYSGVRWSMPPPAYFESSSFPLLCIAQASVVYLLLQSSLNRWPVLAHWLTSARWLTVLVLPIAATFYCGALTSPWPKGSAPSAPPSETVKLLSQELTVPVSGEFRGSVATVVGVPGGGIATSEGLDEEARFSTPLMKFAHEVIEDGFDAHLLMNALWRQGIPTFEENNHMVTTPLYYLYSRVLCRPIDFQARNWLLITQPRPKIMAALGCRFLVTDLPQQEPAFQRRLTQHDSTNIALFLYELAGPNLGQYSPTVTRVVPTARQVVDIMKTETLDYTQEVMLEAPLPPEVKLTPAQQGKMFFERGGVRIVAHSEGTSLIVLPLQFSNSLRITACAVGQPDHIRLLRCNLLMTGVLFQGSIDLKLAHVFGLFRDLKGRAADIDDCRRLGIVPDGTISYPPNYQPHAWSNRSR